MSLSAAAFFLKSSSGYTVANSLRFRASNSANISRTPSSTTNRRTFTFSWWMKPGTFATGTNQQFFNASSGASSDSDWFGINFGSSTNSIAVQTWTTNMRVTTALFRDPSAWYHVVVAVDTTQATAANRVRIYINGVEQTNFSTNNNVAQNTDLAVNNSAAGHRFGRRNDVASEYWDGYVAEMNFIDGQQLTPSSFGQTDATTGAWVPRRYTGTYGTNGFYLPFNDAASTTTISQDRSGNGNNWTSSGISVTSGATFDQMLDTPTNNFATFNALDVRNVGSRTIQAGNLDLVLAGNGGARTTQALPITGKWYWEVNVVSATGGNFGIGLGTANGDISGAVIPTECITYNANGNTTQAGAYIASAYATYTNGDIIGVEYDADANTVRFRKNNTQQGGSALSTSGMVSPLFALIANPATAHTVAINFGQRPFAYTPPTGFVALNTANLSTPSLPNGASAFQATLRTGTGATASVSSLAFQPDLVWIKSRSNATNNNLFDSTRGVQNGLVSNSGSSEYADANSLTAFNSNGYSLGTDGSSRGVNINTNTYVDWAWRKGAAYGFDAVGYTGTGVARTVAHSLNAVPHMMIVKNRSTGNGWSVYHRNQDATPQNGNLVLNSTAAYGASSEWNSTAPTSSVFTVGSSAAVNGNTNSLIAYLWTSIPGFSLMSSYTGNGSADGPFVWCGFKPRFVLWKRIDTTGDWYIFDTVRNTFNTMTLGLYPNRSDAETNFTVTKTDITANGFKLRDTGADFNASGGTYVFAAFAENPFKYANAR